MHRLFAVVLTSAFFALVAPAAPVPKHLMKGGPVYYFPTTPGAKWVYETGGTFVVSEVEDTKGGKVVTVMSEAGGKLTPSERMEVTETGLVRLSGGGSKFDVPLPMLQGPFRVGTTWEIKTSGAQGTGTIAALETIKVPAGTFESVRVEL
jgi:hypothetical protein